MRNGTNRFWLCIAAAVAVSAIAIPAASAGVRKVDTEVTILRISGGVGTQGIRGAVTPRRCGYLARVVVFKQRPGADRKVGADRGNWDGLWELLLPGGTLHRGDRVYARVKRRETDRYTCRTDRSQTETWPCTFVCGGIPPTTATTLPLARGVIRPQPLRNT